MISQVIFRQRESQMMRYASKRKCVKMKSLAVAGRLSAAFSVRHDIPAPSGTPVGSTRVAVSRVRHLFSPRDVVMTSLAHSPRGSRAALEVPSTPEISGHEPAHEREPTRAEIMAALQAAKDAGQQIASLREEVRQLRAEAATGVHRSEELCDVRQLPTSIWVSQCMPYPKFQPK
jgi:hypothetical protein